ncbi:MAG: type III polyketide synthase [Bacteroidota bacterium]
MKKVRAGKEGVHGYKHILLAQKMRNVFLNSLGTAVPDHTLDRESASNFMKRFLNNEKNIDDQIDILFRASGIQKRYTFIQDYLPGQKFTFFPESDNLEPFPSTAERMAFFKNEGSLLAEKAAQNALVDSSFLKKDITHLITVSCTGMYAPGLDLELQDKLELNKDLKRTNINFMGCFAAVTALRMASEISMGNPNAVILVVCLEACTIHFQKDYTEDNLLANALFGDGSAAAIVSSKNSDLATEIIGFHSEIKQSSSNEMAWDIGDKGFLMKLSSYVPEVINESIKEFVDQIKVKLNVNSFNAYAIHPGGKAILKHIKTQLGLSEKEMSSSNHVLKNYGNMSSASILFVLEHLLKSGGLNESKNILGMAFGPGLTFESVVLNSSS